VSPARVPWTVDYQRRHRKFVGRVLDDPALLERFRSGARLPRRYGIGFDERVVEYPWALAHTHLGRVLDAGSSLNHEHVLQRFASRCDELHIVTLAAEAEAFPEFGVLYSYADLRDLPYPEHSFDTVVAISTLEHVGMDTSRYGRPGGRSRDPDRELERAVSELRRVLTTGGSLLATVPYGQHEDHGWFRQFGLNDVAHLMATDHWRAASATVYRYSRKGWQLSSLEEAATERYWDHHRDPVVPDDRAAAARAVVCLLLEA
jgi:SAM-dependent methyltransferase